MEEAICKYYGITSESLKDILENDIVYSTIHGDLSKEIVSAFIKGWIIRDEIINKTIEDVVRKFKESEK